MIPVDDAHSDQGSANPMGEDIRLPFDLPAVARKKVISRARGPRARGGSWKRRPSRLGEPPRRDWSVRRVTGRADEVNWLAQVSRRSLGPIPGIVNLSRHGILCEVVASGLGI